MNIEINQFTDSQCDDFLTQMPEGKICHSPTWANTVTNAAGLKNFYLTARLGNQVHGILPLAHAKSRIFGNFMISQAFSDYGGILADSSKVRDGLFNYAVELAKEKQCDFIEFRNVEPLPYDLVSRSGKMCMHLPLTKEPDEVWKSFKPKVRNQVRKAEKSNIVALDGHNELFDEFYHVYATRMHQLGTPVYPRKLLYDLLQAFPEKSRLFIVQLNNTTIGGALTFYLNGFVEIPFASTLTKYNSLCPNNLLYWSIIEYYCCAGAKKFDFGRCTVDSPTYRFKKQWGPQPVDLHYQYWTRPDYKLSILSPDNPRYRKKIEMWKRLPQWTARLLGPFISRNLP